MKKTAKILTSSIMAVILIMSLQITALAAVSAVNEDDNSTSLIMPINEDSSVPQSGVASGTGTLNDVAGNNLAETRNPETGSSGMMIPGVVALLAVSTAAITLASKNK